MKKDIKNKKLTMFCKLFSLIIVTTLFCNACMTDAYKYTDKVELVNSANNGDEYAKRVLDEFENSDGGNSLDDISQAYKRAWDKIGKSKRVGYLKWLIEAAERGSWRARIAIGEALYDEDRREYIKTHIPRLEQMSFKGSEFARYELLRYYEQNYKPEDIGDLIEPICNAKNLCDARWRRKTEREAYQINFMLTMSRLYREGMNGEFIDEKRSMEWFRKSVSYLEEIRPEGDLMKELYLAYGLYDRTKSGSGYLTRWLFENPRKTNAKFLHDYAMEIYNGGEDIEQNKKEAYKWFLKAAEYDYPQSMFIIGSAYDRGGDLNENAKTAAYWYQKAAKKGFDKAKLALAYLYKQGRGVKQNQEIADNLIGEAVYDTINKAEANGDVPELKVAELFKASVIGTEDAKEAFAWYKKAANKGNAFAGYELARRYENGIGVEKNIEKAIHWYELSSVKKYEKSQIAMGRFYLEGVDKHIEVNTLKAMKYLLSPAENGNPYAALQLGKIYLEGTEIAQDIPQAQKWLTIAADGDEVEAMMILGVRYFRGDLFEVNRKVAAHWLNIVDGVSSKEANAILDEVDLRKREKYSKDLYKDQNVSRLYILMAKAKDENDPLAQYLLAKYFDIGPTLQLTYDKEANYWYEQAASSGVVDAQFILAYRYFNGVDAEKNYEKAALWMSLAAENKHDLATAYMGLMSINGYGMNTNVYQGIKYYKKAASSGNDWAQYHLGKIYYDGLIIDKDRDLAIRWIRKSAVQRNQLARDLYCKIYKNDNYLAKDDEFAKLWCNK